MPYSGDWRSHGVLGIRTCLHCHYKLTVNLYILIGYYTETGRCLQFAKCTKIHRFRRYIPKIFWLQYIQTPIMGMRYTLHSPSSHPTPTTLPLSETAGFAYTLSNMTKFHTSCNKRYTRHNARRQQDMETCSRQPNDRPNRLEAEDRTLRVLSAGFSGPGVPRRHACGRLLRRHR